MKIKPEVEVTLKPARFGQIVTQESYSMEDRVMRGPDWEYTDQDSGAGNIGTIVGHGGHGWVNVIWSNGNTYSYRVGYDQSYDLVFAE